MDNPLQNQDEVDRYGHPVPPTSFIHHRVSAEEDMRIIRAYLERHLSELTTVQIHELDEIYDETIRSITELKKP